jgi:hypothetical protein
MVNHQLLGGAAGDFFAQVVGDQGEGEVDAGGDAGGGPELAVAGVDAVGLEFHAREAFQEIRGAAPMGGAALAVEHAGLGEDVGARADRADAAGGFHGGADEGLDLRVEHGRAGALAAGDDDGVVFRLARHGLGHPDGA